MPESDNLLSNVSPCEAFNLHSSVKPVISGMAVSLLLNKLSWFKLVSFSMPLTSLSLFPDKASSVRFDSSEILPMFSSCPLYSLSVSSLPSFSIPLISCKAFESIDSCLSSEQSSKLVSVPMLPTLTPLKVAEVSLVDKFLSPSILVICLLPELYIWQRVSSFNLSSPLTSMISPDNATVVRFLNSDKSIEPL